MRLRSVLSNLLLAAALPFSTAQQAAPARPAFEVATIKPSGPKGSPVMGFYSRPGGRVSLGNSTAKTILFYAFDIPPDLISGGPEWVSTNRYDVEAVPPETSASRTAKQPPLAATPSGEQRKMLQTLLADRFGLKAHMEAKEGDVYILSRGTGKLLLQEPKDKDADTRGGVMNKQGIYDGEAFGSNISMPTLAKVLTGILGQTVVDQTGISGNYDFHLPPVDPENHDKDAATFDAMHRLGLNLKRGKGPIQTLVIDHIEKPTEN